MADSTPDIRDRIRAEIEWQASSALLARTLHAVVDLHSPDLNGDRSCEGCRIHGVGFVWPENCRTIRRIAHELGLIPGGGS